jgi:hypothetical protein
VIDLSWNCISKRPSPNEAEVKLKALKASKGLIAEEDDSLGHKWGYAL